MDTKVRETLDRILGQFESGNLPKALAKIFFSVRRYAKPCDGWSWGNQLLLVLADYDDARSYKEWQRIGRHVKKGERCFRILVPLTYTRKVVNKKTGEPEKVTRLRGFRAGARFGYEQTEGEPLPEREALQQETNELINSLPFRNVAERWGLRLSTFDARNCPYLGYYEWDTCISLGIKNQVIWAHELVHAADDRLGTLKRNDKQNYTNEVVAQLGACLLLTLIGNDVEADLGFTFSYIKSYCKQEGKDVGMVCYGLVKRICQCVSLVLYESKSIEEYK